MASLNGTFDASGVAPAQPMDPLPAGKYRAHIIESELLPTRSGDGQYLKLVLEVLDGPYARRKLWDQLNLVNASTQTMEIAQRTLSAICHAVGQMQVPDSVLRITRHKGRGIETEHPAVFPVALPALLMQTYANLGDAVFEPFAGSGTTILAGQRTGRKVRGIELAPAYVDLAIARYRMLFPELSVVLDGDGRGYDAIAAERAAEVTANAA